MVKHFAKVSMSVSFHGDLKVLTWEGYVGVRRVRIKLHFHRTPNSERAGHKTRAPNGMDVNSIQMALLICRRPWRYFVEGAEVTGVFVGNVFRRRGTDQHPREPRGSPARQLPVASESPIFFLDPADRQYRVAN